MPQEIPKQLFDEVKERLGLCTDHYATEYERVKEHLRFADGDQWTKELRKGRRKGAKEVKHNIIKPYVNRIVNPIRMHPIGGNVTGNHPILEPARAKLRRIEKNSRASEAIELALENAVKAGYGWMELVIKDNRGRSELAYSTPAKDPVAIMIDPDSTDVTGADAWYAFKLGSSSISKIKTQFGDADYSGMWDGIAGDMSANTVHDITYWRKTTEGVEIYRFVGHQLVYSAELPLDELPIVPIYGDSYRREDDKYFWTGIVQWAKDDQALLNSYKSLEATRIAKAPTPQWQIERRQIGESAQSKEMWNNPNRYDTLVYDATDINGQPIPAPVRVDPTAAIQDLQAPIAAAQAGVGEVLGMPPAMFGLDPEAAGESGKALLARQSAAEIGTAQYSDNAKKSVQRMTAMILKLIPLVYTAPEEVEVTDEDGDPQKVMIDWRSPEADLTALDIDVDSGPAYESKRKENANLLMEAVKLNPQAAPVLLDIALREQDAPGAKEMAKRLRTMLPPELQQKKGQQPPDPQAVQALQAAQQTVQNQEQEIQALQELVSQLQAALVANENKNNVTLAVKQMEIESNQEINRQNNIVKLQIAGVQADQKVAMEGAKQSAETERTILNIEAQAQSDNKQAAANIAQALSQQPQPPMRGPAPGGIIANRM